MMNIAWSPVVYYSIMVLDILIVAYIIYSLLNFFIPNNILPLTMFLAIFIIVIFIAQIFKMQLTLWLIQKLLFILPFAILVLFQQEFKQFLTHKLGNSMKKLFANNPSTESSKEVSEILRAFQYFSRNKIGAIIVIEKNSSLDIIKSKAVSISAKISSPLLISIFNPTSPLHDGAVIVQNNKIAVASAFLPLTDKETTLRFGSRHRAAIGITETTDAIALTVSEETGHISYTKAGEIFDNIPISKIEDLLLSDIPQGK